MWSVWLRRLEIAKGDYVGFIRPFYSRDLGFIKVGGLNRIYAVSLSNCSVGLLGLSSRSDCIWVRLSKRGDVIEVFYGIPRDCPRGDGREL